MKVIKASNYSLESLGEILVKDNLTREEADKLADSLNDEIGSQTDWYYTVKQDDYVLWRGMDDIV